MNETGQANKRLDPEVSLAILGGTGFYSLADDLKSIDSVTPFGQTSAAVSVGRFGGKTVAFLARHGNSHEYPAHRVPYRANLWALHSLGIRTLISTFSCGSLQPEIAPGDFLVCDQIIDRTHNRNSTFYEPPDTYHPTFADPYCSDLRAAAVSSAEELGLPFHRSGTVVVIQGPRFSTKAESQHYSEMGAHIINMTQMPEAILATELGICFVGIAMVTDYDAGISAPESGPDAEPVSMEMVLASLKKNITRVHQLVEHLVSTLPESRVACCAKRKGPPLSAAEG